MVCFGGKGNFPLQLEGLFLDGHYKRSCKQCCLFHVQNREYILKDNIFVKIVNCTYIYYIFI